MGKRREPRKAVQVPVRIFGTDVDGKIFSEKVTTATVSNSGVRLDGVRARLNVDEIVGLTYGNNKVHFRVKWVGTPGTTLEGAVGLVNLTPERPMWDFPLPHAVLDNFREDSRGDRRASPRVKCAVSVELKAEGEPNMWGKASDLSTGGCFVEMPIPLKLGTKFEIVLWISGTKLKLQAAVASSAPGYGIGIRFIDLSPQNKELLRSFISTISPEV